MRRRWTSLLLILLTLSPAAWAESLYVIDTLRVNVRQEPGRNTPPLGVVVTGMALEELERRDGFVKIRGEDGMVGWIKDDYVTTEKPAQLLHEEGTEQVALLRDEVKQANEALAAALRDKEEALEQLARAQREVEELGAMAATAPAPISGGSTGDVTGNEPRFQLSSDTLPYWIGGILFIALLGFLSGISWYKNHVSRRLGGLRI